jgi:hypothetical protein
VPPTGQPNAAFWIKTYQARTRASFLQPLRSSLMREFVICVLVVGLAVLLIVGLLSVIQDLLSGHFFTAPSLPNEEHVD